MPKVKKRVNERDKLSGQMEWNGYVNAEIEMKM